MTRSRRVAFTLVELLVVIAIMGIVLAALIAAVSKAKQFSSHSERMTAGNAPAAAIGKESPLPTIPSARVKSFDAKVELTPRLSVGTLDRESIYEARFAADLEAQAQPNQEAVQIALPLPPQVISLADLSITVDKNPSDSVAIRNGNLIWTGKLPEQSVPIKIAYSAVGKGLYSLETPASHILGVFQLELTTVGSDVRMLDLSLQPTEISRVAQQTIYKWDYKNLMFGRPVTLDVLGIAPIDRLGELRWLGPLSVATFGLIVGIYAHAFRLQRFDRWLLLLTLGTFAGAYPLMYYAQEFVPLRWAIVGSAVLVIAIVTLRAMWTIGRHHALIGVFAPAASVMSLTLIVATQPSYQGLLLTIGAIVFFVVAMVLLPRLSFEGLSKSTASLAPATPA